jgi:hypothetical protein
MNDFHYTVEHILIVLTLLTTACAEPEMDRRPLDAAMRDASQPDVVVATFCKGQSFSCDSFDLSFSTDCEAQVGCVAERSCQRDFLFSCFSITSPAECIRIGCGWASTCESDGTGHLCFNETNPTSCAAKPGCRWESYCDAFTHPSDAHCSPFTTEAACKNVLACAWGYLTCSGTPAICSTLDEAACLVQRGCAWMP